MAVAESLPAGRADSTATAPFAAPCLGLPARRNASTYRFANQNGRAWQWGDYLLGNGKLKTGREELQLRISPLEIRNEELARHIKTIKHKGT